MSQYQLYKIDKKYEDLIESYVDHETGLIPDEILPELEQLEMQKEEIIIHSGTMFHQYDAMSEACNNEIKRLQALKKRYENRKTTAQKIIRMVVPEGTKAEFGNLLIKWVKSSSVEVDELFFDAKSLYKTNPDLVDMKVEFNLKKNEIKKLAKENKPLPEHVKIIEKQNLQVK